MYLGHYPDWIRFGWGLKQGGFDVSDFCDITRGMMSQKSDADAIKVWNSGKSGGVTLGTCIHMLKMHHGPDCFKGLSHKLSLPTSKVASIPTKKFGTINVVNAEPGSGKSTAQHKLINSSGEKSILALPTIELILEGGPDGATIITSNSKESVGQQFNHALYANKRVIMITHAALFESIDASTFKKLSKYNLYIDEVVQPLKLEKLVLEKSIGKDGVLNRTCKFIPLRDATDIYRIKIKNRKAYNRYLKTVDTTDTIENEKTRTFLKSVDDPKNVVLISKMDRSQQGNYCVATLFNLRLFKHFKSVTLISAYIEHTMLYHCFARYYDLVDVTAEYRLTRNLNHRLSSLVLMYLMEGNYSKYARENTRFCQVDDEDFCTQYFEEHQRHHEWAITMQDYNKIVLNGCTTFDVDCTLMINNKDDGQPGIGIPISPMCHGINKHQDKHSISYVAAFNLPPWANPFLKKLIPDYDPWFEKNVLTAVQAIMRTSLRNSESDAIVHALLPDKRTCIAIKTLLKGLPKIKKHCYQNAYKEFVIEKTKRKLLTQEEKRERKRISNQKYNAIHNQKRKKSKLFG